MNSEKSNILQRLDDILQDQLRCHMGVRYASKRDSVFFGWLGPRFQPSEAKQLLSNLLYQLQTPELIAQADKVIALLETPDLDEHDSELTSVVAHGIKQYIVIANRVA